MRSPEEHIHNCHRNHKIEQNVEEHEEEVLRSVLVLQAHRVRLEPSSEENTAAIDHTSVEDVQEAGE